MDATNLTQNDIDNSFLKRVPALVKSGLTFNDAMQKAYDDEFMFLIKLQGDSTAKEYLSRKLHSRFNSTEAGA